MTLDERQRIAKVLRFQNYPVNSLFHLIGEVERIPELADHAEALKNAQAYLNDICEMLEYPGLHDAAA